MSRLFPQQLFREHYERAIVRGRFNEEPEYYPRYRARYEYLLRLYSGLAPSQPQDVLDVGGGQLGLLCHLLWQDRVVCVDLGGEHLDYLHSQGVKTKTWNLCADPPHFETEFDCIFFSEVIEHIPIPGHVVLASLRALLRPGGLLICSTPNLYRLRNVVYLVLGKRIFDYFRYPTDRGLGHVIEYSQDHLAWQLQRGGFDGVSIELREFRHTPTSFWFAALRWCGMPLFLVPRFRSHLIAVAQTPPTLHRHGIYENRIPVI